MSAGFNFNNITLSDSADITKVMENFTEIETYGIKAEDATRLVSTIQDGWMSKEDKEKLNGIEAGAEVNNITTVTLNGTSQTIEDGTLAMTEEDPTVPSWAKQSTKPSYTWEEISGKPNIATQTVITNFWYGTEAQYDAISSKNSSTLYLIQEEAD